VSLRCPYTLQSIFIKEAKGKDGNWVWLYRGREYNTPDEVLDSRRKKYEGEVDFGQ
jgi:hypothetical protein